ncbi:MAG: hypothetical protein RQ824_00090 [bacterium]|nr:hypothetical protein [bacterium]
MKLTGDEKGIDVLKGMHSTNNDYLKFLLQEAKTVFGNIVDFKADGDNQKYRLHFNPASGEFTVEKL